MKHFLRELFALWRAAGLFWLAAVAGCGSNRPSGPAPDAELVTATSAARVAFNRGMVDEAARLYERALMRARAMDDPAEIADAAYNAAACYTSLGLYVRAGDLLDEAKREIRRSGARAGDILLLQARVLWLQGKTAQALAAGDEVLAQNPPATAGERVQVHCLRGRIACDAGDAAKAAEELALARRDVSGTSDPIPLARVAELSGRVEQLSKRPAKAAAEFDREASLLRDAHLYGDMVQALARAGGAYKEAGEQPVAAERYYRAGRSALGQGNRAAALKWAKAGMEAAQASGDEGVLSELRVLLGEIEGK